MATNAILEAIRTSTEEERDFALAELLKRAGFRHDKPLRLMNPQISGVVVPLVRNGRVLPDLSPEEAEEMNRRSANRDEHLRLEDVIESYLKK